VTAKTRVLVADGHPLIREGIRFFLRENDSFAVIGEAANGEETINQAVQFHPDIIVLALNLPVIDGLEAAQRVRQLMPWVEALVLLQHPHRDLLCRVQAAGVRGCLAKASSPIELTIALETIRQGRPYYPADLARTRTKTFTVAHPLALLSDREVQVLTMLSDGLLNKEVAARLGISVRTVEKHRENILDSLGLHNIADLVRFAVSQGLTQVPFTKEEQGAFSSVCEPSSFLALKAE
jgi:DNA-binding NarL/FixJ family response regulator